MKNIEKDKVLVPWDLILIVLFPPILPEYEIRAPEDVRVSILDGFVEIRDKNLKRLIEDFKIISKLLPRYIKYNRGARGVHIFRFAGKAKILLDQAYKLSRLARSLRKFLVAWIVTREIFLQLITHPTLTEAGLYILLPSYVTVNYSAFRKYQDLEDSREDIKGIKITDIFETLQEHFADRYRDVGDGKIRVETEPFIKYMIKVIKTMSLERFELMNIICSNPPIHTYPLVNMASEVLHRKKSWIYESIKALEQVGLIVRYNNIHPKVKKRKKRIEKIILPSCVAWKLAPCTIELPTYDIRIRVTKPKEYACIRGYKEDEIFAKPNIETLKMYANNLQRLGIAVNWEKTEKAWENKREEISRIPCPIFRYVMQILYDIVRKSLSLRDRGVRIEKDGAPQLSLNLIKIFNELCRILGIEFEIEYEENEPHKHSCESNENIK